MEAVKTWGISVCTVLVITSLISMIIPKINENKVVYIIISTFILVGILSPLLKILNSNEFNITAINSSVISDANFNQIELSEQVKHTLEESTVSALYPMITEILNKYKVTQFGVKVMLETQKNGISVKSVNITIHEPHINNTDVISSDIKNELGIDANVLNAEGK